MLKYFLFCLSIDVCHTFVQVLILFFLLFIGWKSFFVSDFFLFVFLLIFLDFNIFIIFALILYYIILKIIFTLFNLIIKILFIKGIFFEIFINLTIKIILIRLKIIWFSHIKVFGLFLYFIIIIKALYLFNLSIIKICKIH